VNWDKLKQNIGYKVQLVPAACHLDAAGDILPPRARTVTVFLHSMFSSSFRAPLFVQCRTPVLAPLSIHRLPTRPFVRESTSFPRWNVASDGKFRFSIVAYLTSA